MEIVKEIAAVIITLGASGALFVLWYYLFMKF